MHRKCCAESEWTGLRVTGNQRSAVVLELSRSRQILTKRMDEINRKIAYGNLLNIEKTYRVEQRKTTVHRIHLARRDCVG